MRWLHCLIAGILIVFIGLTVFLWGNTTSEVIVNKYEECDRQQGSGDPINSDVLCGQYFTAGSDHTVERVVLSLKKSGSPADLLVKFYACDINHKPTGPELASAIIDPSEIGTSYGDINIDVTPFNILNGNEYCFICSSPDSPNASNGYTIEGQGWDDPCPNTSKLRSSDGGSTWSVIDSHDNFFEIWGDVVEDYVSPLPAFRRPRL